MKLLATGFLHAAFVFAVIFIWFMLLYQFVLCLGGYRLRMCLRRHVPPPVDDAELPEVTLLVPARNEEKVITAAVARLLCLQYPAGKLDVVVVNDGSSDRTAALARQAARGDPRLRVLDIPAAESGRGKSSALNRALNEAHGRALAIYDADNVPEPDSLLKLARALVTDDRLVAVTGKFRAYNLTRNLLTRFINLESIAFQWIVQAGRWQLLRIASLPGTNFIIWKSAVVEAGGWDEEALTEDAELTFRLYQRGGLVRFLPDAVTWEQEPERLSTWIRQRTRWARGNNYLIARYGRELFRGRLKGTATELLHLFYLYYLFIFAILFSDIVFLLSLTDLFHVRVVGPYGELWLLAFLLYVLEVMIALSFEREDSLRNLLVAVLAYLTYTKLWVFVVLRSLWHDYVRRKERHWDKTERFSPGGGAAEG